MRINNSHIFNPLWLTLILIGLVCSSFSYTDNKPTAENERQARQLFNQTYQLVFGPQGCTLQYAVNIIGIYKTHGTVFYKGKNMHYVEPRYSRWITDKYDYMIDNKKKTVKDYRNSSANKDDYLSKYTYNVNDFIYSWENSKEGYIIRLKLKKSHFTGIREVKALVDKKTHYPINLRVKVAFFWTTVHISNFRSGNISDQVFVFPKERYAHYKWIKD